jgi:hypothetical protein
MDSGHNNLKKTRSSETDSRRKFLQKTSAGVLIASIPAKSVWANGGGGGILNSIAASTHASGWTGGCLSLKSHGYWGNTHGEGRSKAVTFQTAFGASALPRFKNGKARWENNGKLAFKESNSWVIAVPEIYKHTLTLYDVISNSQYMHVASFQIAAMYLNGKHHQEDAINFPVWNSSTHRPFASLQYYADWLYSNINTGGFGEQLGNLIDSNSTSSSC